MSKLIIGLTVGLIVLPLAAFTYVWLGYAPVATSSRPLPMERTIARMALRQAIAREAPKQAPIAATEPNVLAGARIFRENCAVCHGLPGEPKTAIAAGEYPPPPQLFHGKGVTDDSVGETYWKVANGIRLTGMPGFHASLTNEQMWQVSWLLADANKLPPSVGAALAPPATTH